MEDTRKWTGWIWLGVLLLITIIVLGVSTLGSADGTLETTPPQTATVQPETGDAAGMTANASAMGYGGPVLVRLTLDDQGRIASMDVGGARFAETPGLGGRVQEDAFIQPFIGLTPPLTLNEDVDAISGATISSQAVVDSVNDAAAFLTQKEGSSDTN